MTLSRISSRSELLSSKLRNRMSPSELSTPLAVFYIRANTTSWCASYSKPSPQWIEKPSQRHIDYYNCLGSHLIARHQSIKICITCKARHHLLLYEGYAILKLAEVSALSVVRQDEDNKATLSATWDLLSLRSSSRSSRRSSSRRSRTSIKDLKSRWSLVQPLRLPRIRAVVSIFGNGGSHSGSSRGKVTLNLRSRVNEAFILSRLSFYQGAAAKCDVTWPPLRTSNSPIRSSWPPIPWSCPARRRNVFHHFTRRPPKRGSAGFRRSVYAARMDSLRRM